MLELIHTRLKNLEDGFTERKPESVSTEDIRKTLVAFANSVPEGEQAILFIGVEDDGTLSGVSNADQKQKDVRRIAEQKCYPPIKSLTSVAFTENDKKVVAVIVSASNNRPHFAGTAYVRIGSESVQAPDNIFEELIFSRNSKAGAIIRQKDKGGTITLLVHTRWTTMGTIGEEMSSGGYSFKYNCEIEECTAHFLRLRLMPSGEVKVFPLDEIIISYDEENGRMMIINR